MIWYSPSVGSTHCSCFLSRPNIFSMMLVFLLTVFLTITGCGKSKKDDPGGPPTNIGGGFTLLASGGTLHDGSGVNGLAVLITLRDSQGWGPTQVWNISITGPGLTNPLVLDYTDPRIGSYMSWEWPGFDPSPGAYRATASNGVTTIYTNFSVSFSVMDRPTVNATHSGNTITVSWPAIPGAHSYSYDVCSSSSICMSGLTTTLSAIAGFSTLSNGDYLIQVKAYSTDRPALFADHTSSPSLATQENVSETLFSFPIGGDQTSGNYSLNAAGGILDWGLNGPSNGIYGLSIWTSIQNTSSPGNPSAPAGDWNIRIVDPEGRVLNYIYPANSRHDAMWYYEVEPVVGAYTVTATYGAASKTATFSIADTTPGLTPLAYTSISAALVTNATNASLKDISLSWPSVSGANSYYVSLFADAWNNITKQYEYREVWGGWVNTTTARVLNGDISAGLQCDVYVTAYAVDMTTAAPPSSLPTRADMSENYYGYPLPFLTQ